MTTIVHEVDYNKKPITVLKDAMIEAISLVDKGANGQRFVLLKRDHNYVAEDGTMYLDEVSDYSIEKATPLIKAGPKNDEWKVAYSVVAVPNEQDIQKDVWTEDEIRSAAHAFLKRTKPLINFMHKDLNRVGDLVESAIALDDIKVGDAVIKKGSWYIGIEPYPEMKKKIQSGEITGVSVQGSSKRIPVDQVEDLAIDSVAEVAKNDYGSKEEEYADAKDQIMNSFVPLGAEGPGIKKLQQIVGLPTSGVFDAATEAAFLNYLEVNYPDAEPEPTIANLKMVLETQGKSTEAAIPADSPLPEQDPTVRPEPQPKTETSVNPTGGRADGYDPSAGVTSFESDAEATVPKIGPQAANVGVAEHRNKLNVNSASEDLRVALYMAFQEGDQDLISYLRDVHRITSGEQILYAPFAHEMLWYMYSRLVINTKTNEQSEENRNVVLNQPSYSPPELMPDGSGAPMRKSVADMDMPDTKKEQYEYLYGTGRIVKGPYMGHKLCKMCQDVTKRCERHQRNVYMEKRASGRLCKNCADVMKVCSSHQAEYYDVKKGAMFEPTQTVVASFRDKNGQEAHPGDVVLAPRGQVVEVQFIDSVENMVQTVHVNQKGEEVVEWHKPSSLSVVVTTQMVKAAASRLGGSMGGQDPRKYGKIKYIVRSFGKWAGGKHRICVARMKSEHPEVFKGNEDAGCAWLKDQWMGTTKWRNKNVKKSLVEGDSSFAVYYNSEEILKQAPDELGDIDSLFNFACYEMNVDPESILSQMDDDFDAYLDAEFAEQSAPVENLLNKFINIFSAAETLSKSEDTDHLQKALNALHLSLSDAMSIENREERLNDINHVLADFGAWLEKNAVPTLDRSESAEKLAQDEDLIKGWMPSTVTEGDLKDEDFAWLSDAYKAGDESASEGRKLPYKVHGKVDPRGWRAAWNMAAKLDTAGGPSVEEVRQKLLRDKPEDIEIDPRLMEKTGGNNMGDSQYSEMGDEGNEGAMNPLEYLRNKKKKMAEAHGEMEKSTDVETSRERLIAEAGSFLNELVESTDEAELEKATDEVHEDGLGIEEVALFADRLADRMDLFEQKFGELTKSLSSKLDTVGELAKSLDLTDRISALEEQIADIKNVAAQAEQVEEVAKRVQDLEQQPGQPTHARVDAEPIAKSASAPLFTRPTGSIF